MVYRLKFKVIAGEISVSEMAPVLAPYGLDVSKVVRELNFESTQLYKLSVPLRLKMKVHVIGASKRYFYNFAPPSRAERFNQISSFERGEKDFLFFYNFQKSVESIPTKASFSQTLGTISSFYKFVK